MKRSRTTRRTVLGVVALAAGCIGVMIAQTLMGGKPEADEPPPEELTAIRNLLAAIGDRQGAAALGEAALASLTDEPTGQQILGRLTHRLGLSLDRLSDMTVERLRAVIRGHVEAEHLAGDTLSVQGWELSRTEARLYALAYLIRA